MKLNKVNFYYTHYTVLRFYFEKYTLMQSLLNKKSCTNLFYRTAKYFNIFKRFDFQNTVYTFNYA